MAIRVKALKAFYDRKDKVNRKVGEEFDVAPKRLVELNACGVEQGGVPLVSEVKPKKAEKAAKEGEEA